MKLFEYKEYFLVVNLSTKIKYQKNIHSKFYREVYPISATNVSRYFKVRI